MQDEVVTRQHFTSNCGSAYARIGDKARRLFNTAVFSRLAVRDGTIVECDFGRPWTSSSACLRSNTEVLWRRLVLQSHSRCDASSRAER